MNPVTCKDWDINSIVSDNSNFFHLRRVPASSPDVDAHIEQFEEDGIPLIIEGFHHGDWPNVFDPEWLRSHGPQTLSVRNVHTRSDSILPIDEFFKISRETSPYAAPNETARLYGKDVECPAEWNDWLHNAQVIPNKLLPKSSGNMLMNLPQSTLVETLMCYIGIGDTYTPAHKDLCASSGQNLMCYTEKDGSSIWFMTESSSTPEVDAFFRKLGNEIDHETQVLSVEDLAKAPFNVYITRQRLGDLVLVPPRSCHQVINSGGISIKMSWSRMTIRGLMTAYYHELPLYRRVCRPETYKIKSIIFYTLLRRASQLRAFCEGRQGNGVGMAADLARVVDLFASILVEEYSGPATQFDPLMPLTASSEFSSFDPQRYEPKDGCLVCDFCGADIFQTYFESEICCADSPYTSQASKPDPFVLCSGCYAEGRSCKCQRMTLLQRYSFNDLHKEWQDATIVLGAYQTKNRLEISAQSFDFQRKYGISQAASVLHKLRDLSSQDGKCRFSGSDHSHTAEEGSFLSCKRCHSSKCFSHVLKDYKMHAVAALTEYSHDRKHLCYHDEHKHSRKQYEGAHHGLIQAEKSGERPELHHQLAHLALIHRTCKPLSTSIVPGWYDRNIELTPISAVSMALTSAVIPQPSVKTSMAPEAHPSTAFDIDGLSETSTLTPTPSTASSSAPLETMQHPMQTPASPAPPKTTQHSKQTPLSTPPTKYSVQRMQHLRDDFLGVYLPAPPERSQTHPSEGKKSIPKVSSKASCSPSIMLEGQRMARVSVKSHIPADDTSAGANARVKPTRKRPHENGDGQQNPPSTSAGRSKLVRVRAHEETPTIREPPPSEQSTFSSSLVHSLQASFETTSVEDEVVDKVVYESGPPPKRSRKSRAVAQPAHKSSALSAEVHSVVDELQEGPSVDLPTAITPGIEQPTVTTPELVTPMVFPTQGDMLRTAAFVTMQLLWNVSGIAQAMDASSAGTAASAPLPHHLMQQPMGTEVGTTGPPPPYPWNEHPYIDVDRPRGVFRPPRVFDARDFARSGDHSGLARSSRGTHSRDGHYGRGISSSHNQPHRNWHADQRRHKDFQHGHQDYQHGHDNYRHRRDNNPHRHFDHSDHRYSVSQYRRNDDQRRYRDNQYWQSNDQRNTQPRHNVHHDGYQSNRLHTPSIHRDNSYAHSHQPPSEHAEESLRDSEEVIKDASEEQEMRDSTPGSSASAAPPFLRGVTTDEDEQTWEGNYEQLEDEIGQSVPHPSRVALPHNDGDTRDNLAASPQALTHNLTHNPWN